MSDTPPSQLAQVLTQLRALWERQTARRRRLAVLVVVALVGVVVWTQFLHRPPGWNVVSEAASPDDTEALASLLRSRGVPVRVTGSKVEVPSDQLDTARAAAAAAGLPQSGKGFELFDGSSFGKSSFTEQINYRRALEGELARSIATLAQVDGARVHLALGRRSVFKEREEAPAASIALRLYPGQVLTAEQVRGIRQLVASSVDGLKADAVTLVDNHGNLLDGGEPGSRDRKADIERTVAGRVRAMLERVVGAGHVTVVATADVDDRQLSETQEVYDHEHPVVRSESRMLDGVDPAQTVGGVAGTRGNLPGAPAATPGAAGGSANGRVQETKNYEVSRTVRQISKPDVEIKRLHVAIVVDFKSDATGKIVARSPEELGELTALARQAAAIDDTRGDKIELRAMAFAPDDETASVAAAGQPAGLPMMYLVGAGAGAFVLLVLILVVAARRRKRARLAKTAPSHVLSLPVQVAELERALARTAPQLGEGEQPLSPALLEGRTVRDRVLDAVRSDVERTAGLLSSWLATSPSPAASTPPKGKPA